MTPGEQSVGGRTPSLSSSLPLACVVLLTLALSALLALRFRFNFNPDSLALLRLAHYWGAGQWSLAASSYWGPLFPMLLSPLLGMGIDPFIAGKLATIGSAIVYLFGARSLFKGLGLGAMPLELCTLLAGVTAAVYSAMPPTADLLMSGLVCFGLRHLLAPDWTTSRRRQCAGGVLLGAAYLAKAFALPLAVLLICAVAVLRAWSLKHQRRVVASAFAVTFVALALSAGPWIAILSIKFDTFMISSSGSLNHAIAGPRDVDRYHPVGRTFHTPPEGREFAWEDPFGMPYRHWSPFENTEYMQHQIGLIQRNATFIIDALGIGSVTLALIALIVVRPWRTPHGSLWAWALPLAALMSCLYLPVFAGALRYYLVAYIVLSASAMMVVLEIAKRFGVRTKIALTLAGMVTALLAVQYQIRPAYWLLHEIDGDYGSAVREALPLASQLAGAGTQAGIASIDDEWRVGMFLAFALDTRWHGNVSHPTLDEVKRSGAQLIVVNRDHPLLAQIAADPDMHEQSVPAPSNGATSRGGRMRYYWYRALGDPGPGKHG